jgi:hypothetical protein
MPGLVPGMTIFGSPQKEVWVSTERSKTSALLSDGIGVRSAVTASSNQDLLKGPRRFVFGRRVFNPAC